MLQFKIVEHILSKGYQKPFSFMMKMFKFSNTKATKYLHGKQKNISIDELSQVCLGLNCTPNDLFYWQQTPAFTLPESHCLVTELSVPYKFASWNKASQQIGDDGRDLVYALMQKIIADKEAAAKARKEARQGDV